MPAKRTEFITESIIRETSRLAKKYDAINLAQGMPDLETPQEMKDAACQAIQAGYNQYPTTWGNQELRQAIADKALQFNNIACDPDGNITVCCGATECMMASLLALVDSGDEIITFQPFYENYYAEILLVGARPIFVQLRPPHWTFDLEELENAFGKKTKAVIINTPHNPSGRVFTQQELLSIAQLCQKFGVYAITDEIYENIIYDSRHHTSIATLPGMWDRTITISGLSKSFNVTGWRLGYCIAPREITSSIRKVHDFLTIGAPHPLQIAGAVALTFSPSYYQDLISKYHGKRELFLAYLHNAGFVCYEPEGTYYVLADISSFGSMTSSEFSKWLIMNIGIAAVPGDAFYKPQKLGKTEIRFMFAKSDDILHEAGERLSRMRDIHMPTRYSFSPEAHH